MYLLGISELVVHPAKTRSVASLSILDFCVKDACLPTTYGFHGFLSKSLIFCLSSGETLGLSNNFGKITFLYFA